MGLERRGRVKRSHDRGNWEQEDFDACDRHAVRLACLLDGSRMSREAHVRFCERPVVQSRRPTHPRSPEVSSTAFDAQPLDLHSMPLMDRGFTAIGQLA